MNATIEIVLATASAAVEISMLGENGQGVPVGGITGALLRKKSAANFDTEWAPTGHGVFTDTTVQAQAAINTPKVITFNTTESSAGVHVDPLNPSRVICDTAGLYNFQFSLQAQMSGGTGNTGSLWVWPRVQGVDVPRSNSHISCTGGDTIVPAWNFLLSLTAGQYFELVWAVSSLAITLDADPAPVFGPSVPSVILTVDKIHQ